MTSSTASASLHTKRLQANRFRPLPRSGASQAQMSAFLTGRRSPTQLVPITTGGSDTVLRWQARLVRSEDDPCNVRAARLTFQEVASSAWSAVRLFTDAARRAAAQTRRAPNSAWNAVTNCRQLALMTQPGHPGILPPRSRRRLQDRLSAA